MTFFLCSSEHHPLRLPHGSRFSFTEAVFENRSLFRFALLSKQRTGGGSVLFIRCARYGPTRVGESRSNLR
ncbi:protein of unknown function (plasmid) [Pararobbsia alpina]